MRKIGKYEVLGELGHGAMGVVYRARDPVINRLVALKTITSGLAEDPNLLQRFYREAQSAGGLHHPNIVTIYDMGDEQNLPYIAMELIEGESLEQTIARRTSLPIALKLTYALQACRAFDYAHKRGIIHRDIKPGNVMVNKESVAKVVDFGIARVLDTSKTQTGMLIGTFAYMSPEQYHGDHADERSDIWSFGVLLYELLSYQKPFSGHNPASLMHSICLEEPRPLRELAPECPPELEAIISKLLRKSPQDRWQSMEDLLLELEPVSRELQSRSIGELVERSRQLTEENDFNPARELLREALKVDPTNTQARNLLEKVNAEIKRLLIRPKALQHVEAGRALLGEGRIQEARVEVESALKLDSSFEPAQELQKRVQHELDRAQIIAEWLQAARQRIAEGTPDEAESFLIKVLELDPANKQANGLKQQVLNERAERDRRLRLLERMQEARGLWTQQKYESSLEILSALGKEFPGEEEIQRLIETVREDQAEQYRRNSLESVRNCLAEGNYAGCREALLELQKQFPNDEEISRLVEEVRLDEAKQRRLQGLAEARTLLASGDYQQSIGLLTSLQGEFSEDQDIPRLLKRAYEGELGDKRKKAIANARSLLGAQRYEDCNNLLAELREQFPNDEEIPELADAVRQAQAEQRKAKSLTDARSLLASGRYGDSIALLLGLQKEFPKDRDISALLTRAREDEEEEQRQHAIAEARSLLAARQYEECGALLAKLRKQFPKDEEIRELLEAVRQGQVEQRKFKSLTEARNLLATRQYEQGIARLTELGKEFPGEEEISALLRTAREAQIDEERQEGITEARSLLAARRYEECSAQLANLRKRFPHSNEVSELEDALRLDQAEQRKLKILSEARGHLAAKNYDPAITMLAELSKEFPGEQEVLRLLATAREGQAEQRKLKSLAEARSLVVAKRYEECVGLLTALQNEFPSDPEIPRLLASIQREQTEQQKQHKLGEARALAAGQRITEALEVIEQLLATFPKDAGIEKLRANLEREREKQTRNELLQRAVENLKSLVSEKKYVEALAREESLRAEFPGNADLLRLLEFARIQQSQLESEARLQSIVSEVKGHSQANRFVEAIHVAKAALKVFSKNPELLYLLEQAEAQHKKQRTRVLIEQAVREIRYKINREDFSDAIDLAKKTLATMGPDSELNQLLNSAVVEFQAREKKREEEKTLQEIRKLIDSGNFDGAAETLYDAMTAATLDELDPRVGRISQEIEAAKSASTQPLPPPAPATLSKEYAFLQAPPDVEPPASRESTAAETPAANSSSAQAAPPSHQEDAAPLSMSAAAAASSTTAPPVGGLPVASPSVSPVASPEVVKTTIKRRPPTRASREAVPGAVPRPRPFFNRDAKRAAAAVTLFVGVILGIWLSLRFERAKTARISAEAVRPAAEAPAKPVVNILETRQLAAIDTADRLIASGDLNGALQALQDGEKLNGPLTEQIRSKELTVAESLRNASLAKLRQQEAVLWQRATSEVDSLKFDAAKRDFQKIANYGDGGVRKIDAQKYLNEVLPRRQQEEDLFRQATKNAGANDAQSLQRAADLLGRVAALGGKRQTEAIELHRNVDARLNSLKQENINRQIAALEIAARELARRGDLDGARAKASQIQQLGGDATTLSREIAQAQGAQAKLAQEQAELQQAVQAYNAVSSSDKGGLQKARDALQAIVRANGSQAGNAQRYLAEIESKLDALNAQPPPPSKPQPEVRPATVSAEPAIRAVIQQFFQAFEQRDLVGMNRVWPTIPRKKYDGYRNSFDQASAIGMQIVAETVTINPDGTSATVSAQTRQQYTPRGKKPMKSAPSWTFQLAKTNGVWVITDVQ